MRICFGQKENNKKPVAVTKTTGFIFIRWPFSLNGLVHF